MRLLDARELVAHLLFEAIRNADAHDRVLHAIDDSPPIVPVLHDDADVLFRRHRHLLVRADQIQHGRLLRRRRVARAHEVLDLFDLRRRERVVLFLIRGQPFEHVIVQLHQRFDGLVRADARVLAHRDRSASRQGEIVAGEPARLSDSGERFARGRERRLRVLERRRNGLHLARRHVERTVRADHRFFKGGVLRVALNDRVRQQRDRTDRRANGDPERAHHQRERIRSFGEHEQRAAEIFPRALRRLVREHGELAARRRRIQAELVGSIARARRRLLNGAKLRDRRRRGVRNAELSRLHRQQFGSRLACSVRRTRQRRNKRIDLARAGLAAVRSSFGDRLLGDGDALRGLVLRLHERLRRLARGIQLRAIAAGVSSDPRYAFICHLFSP
nr:hypothetical protein [Paraburkholderia tropica]